MSAALAKASHAAISRPDTAISDITVERRYGLTFRRFGKIFDRGNDIPYRLFEIRLEVAVAYDSLVGVEVDQNHGPVSKQPDF
jgi:hypothetical protein